MRLRIDPQNPPAEPATRAPGATRSDDTGVVAIGIGRGELVAGYDALIATLGASLDGVQGGADGRAGPVGIADAAARELNDPLGLATRQAAVTPAESPLTEAPTTTPSRRAGDVSPDRPALRFTRFGHGGATAEPGATSRGTGAPAEGPGAPKAPDASAIQQAAPRVAPVAAESGANPVASLDARGGGRSVTAIASPGGGAAGGGTGQGTQNGPPGSLPGVASIGGGARSPARPEGLSFAKHAQHLRSQHAEVAPQVAKGLAALVLRDGGRAQIQLRPEALGRVEVDLSIRDGVVNATLSAENETARDLLGSELDRLRVLLEQRGLRVESLEIVSDPAEPEARGGADENRGSRWMSAQDESRGDGRDAGAGSPGSGGREHRARDGGPMPRAERGRPGQDAGTAEIGAASESGDLGSIGGRSPPGLWVRLDTVA